MNRGFEILQGCGIIKAFMLSDEVLMIYIRSSLAVKHGNKIGVGATRAGRFGSTGEF